MGDGPQQPCIVKHLTDPGNKLLIRDLRREFYVFKMANLFGERKDMPHILAFIKDNEHGYCMVIKRKGNETALDAQRQMDCKQGLKTQPTHTDLLLPRVARGVNHAA